MMEVEMAHQNNQSSGTDPSVSKSITVTPDMISGNYEVDVDLGKSQPILKANEYQCAYCRQVYEYGWSDEEAQAEYEANFPVSSKIDTNPNIVCDDCYREMTAQLPPLQYEAEVNDLELKDD